MDDSEAASPEPASIPGDVSDKPRRARPAVRNLALAGAALLWAAMEPLGWWPLGWVALGPWTLVALAPQAPNRREVGWLWLGGAAFWLVALYGLCFAHPAMFLGWITLCVYLGAYVPVFVGVTRVGLRLRIPAVIVVPTVWVGLELIRGYAFTGFSACLLGHSQAALPMVIQVTDLQGSYAVSFVLAAVAAAVARAIKTPSSAAGGSGFQARGGLAPGPLARFGGFAFAGVLVVGTLVYGGYRLGQVEATAEARPLRVRVALIQRNEPVTYIMTPSRQAEIFDSYLQGSQAAMRSAGGRQVDLVVWPESMFTRGLPWMMLEPDAVVPAEAAMDQAQFATRIETNAEIWQQNAGEVQRRLTFAGVRSTPPSLLVGSSTMRFAERAHTHSGAVFVGPDGRVVDWYGKRHLVMFGEYIPFFEWFPALYQLAALPRVTPGEQAKVFDLQGTAIAPNICFETAVEHVTVGAVRELTADGTPPDVIVNLTNDAWFGGSPILEHHQRCSQFMAVATRRPLLMASNTGPTMWVDGSGRMVASLEKNTHGHILATPTVDGRWGWYQSVGDWPVRGLALVVAVLAVVGLVQRRQAADSF